MKKTLALAGAIAAASCVSVDTDPQETGSGSAKVIVEFDPGNSVVPFPNNLLLDRTTGKVNLPTQCGESPLAGALRTLVVNALDGFGTFKTAMRITFTKPVDPTSLAGNVVLYRRATGTTPADPATAQPIPLVFIPGKTVRFSADCSTSAEVDAVTVVPAIPLTARSTYTVAVLAGVKSADGVDFNASSTWGLVRQSANPVTVENGVIISDRTPLNPADAEDKATLLGLDLLWKAHAQGLGFIEAIGKPRANVLLAWEFNTQTTTTPLDPAVAGTPAANQPKAAMTAVTTIATGATDVPTHMEATLRTFFGAPAGVCIALNCALVGTVYNGTVTGANYQSPGTNPIPGGPTVPGPFSNPVTPMKFGDNALSVRILTPTGAAPTGGWPTIVFGHGLGGNRLLSYFVASQLAGQGFATASIDFVAQGARSVQISNAGVCATPNPALTPQCYAPIFSTNLATTRDNIRQSVLDVQAVVNSLKLCNSATACGGFEANSAKIGYMGISLGGIIGSVIVATTDVKGAVLNVPGVGLVDILENTETLAIRCSTVDGLIDAGIITGTKWNGVNGAGATGTCAGVEWRSQPGYLTFSSIARWVLDSSDGANFASRLATKRFLIQKVKADTVVPNVATDTMGRLLAVSIPAPPSPATNPVEGDATDDAVAAPTAWLLTAPQTNKWLQYTSNANFTFVHGSLLNGGATVEALRGTRRVQVDAITFLVNNVKN
jgi:pimeloyl-ACP methyl ester carboxylesterase